jgi:glycolate oxidase FAD binding subunit
VKDLGDDFQQAIVNARDMAQRLSIVGTGSKTALTGDPNSAEGRLLSTVEHTGIVDYRPDELVVTVRSGTPLRELNQALAREGQMLGFEPPEYRGLGTAGGAVAAGIAGPGRAWRGGARDAVLGVQMINGLGERLTFGGQVMKNVAGFDVSRLQAGAFGMLGLLLEVSLKVLPLPQSEQTVRLELNAADAHVLMLKWMLEPQPITATAWLDDALWVRLSGAEAAVNQASAAIGGELQPDNDFWAMLRDHSLPLLRSGPIACRHLPPAGPLAAEDQLLEWNGARRWTTGETAPGGYQPYSDGYARYRCRDGGGDPVIARYQARIKAAFDPDNLFNPELTDADVAA